MEAPRVELLDLLLERGNADEELVDIDEDPNASRLKSGGMGIRDQSVVDGVGVGVAAGFDTDDGGGKVSLLFISGNWFEVRGGR